MAEGEGSEKESVPWWQVEINPVPEWFRRRRLSRRPIEPSSTPFVPYPRGRARALAERKPLTREEWQPILRLREVSGRSLLFSLMISAQVPNLVFQVFGRRNFGYWGWVIMLVVAYLLSIGNVVVIGQICKGDKGRAIPELAARYSLWKTICFVTPFMGFALPIWLHSLVSREVRRHGLRVFPFESTRHALDELLAEQEREASEPSAC